MHFKRIEESKKEVISSISKYGKCAEHNYFHFLYKQNPSRECYFFDFGDSKGACAFLSKESKVMTLISDMLAPRSEWGKLLHGFFDFCKKEFGTSKIKIEIDGEFKRVLENEEGLKLNVNYSLDWPVYNLEQVDNELNGRMWKKVRNIRNNFLKGFEIKVHDARNTDARLMNNVLDSWLSKRSTNDYVDVNYYRNAFKDGFSGCDIARAYKINGKISAISAGWRIPNSNCAYYGIGLMDYGIKNLGDFVNIEDILFAKSMGFGFVDLGGSDDNLLKFKKKFRPERIYRTFACTLRGKNGNTGEN